MARKYRIRFRKAHNPIAEAVTKFGGQPVWISDAEWPLSRSTGTPMMFVGQIALTRDLFGETVGRMAYLFITDDRSGMLPTWDPEGGENAVVVQPGMYDLPTAALACGPHLQLADVPFFVLRATKRPFEYAVELEPCEEPNPVPTDVFETWDRARQQAYMELLLGNKIGGAPAWVQEDQTPTPGRWRLLLQLEADQPLPVNFGDAGVGYVFIDEDGTRAEFLWQSH